MNLTYCKQQKDHTKTGLVSGKKNNTLWDVILLLQYHKLASRATMLV